jgi:hypothetical protein
MKSPSSTATELAAYPECEWSIPRQLVLSQAHALAVWGWVTSTMESIGHPRQPGHYHSTGRRRLGTSIGRLAGLAAARICRSKTERLSSQGYDVQAQICSNSTIV